MPVPANHGFPIQRPGFITGASWLGADNDLDLQVSYTNALGNPAVIQFAAQAVGRPGEVCVPASSDFNNLGPRARDILAAHLRMACMVAGHAVPGSREFNDVFIQSGSNNFQTSISNAAKVNSSAMVSDTEVDILWKIGANGPIYTTRLGHGELGNYVFVPQTQLLVIPGAVKAQFSNYVHNHPSQVLTQAQKDDIVAYVIGLKPWV